MITPKWNKEFGHVAPIRSFDELPKLDPICCVCNKQITSYIFVFKFQSFHEKCLEENSR